MQLFKVDLEGDGTEEIFIYAQNIMNSTSKAFRWEADQPLISDTSIPKISQVNHYSLLLLRKIIDGKVKEIPLGQFIAPDTQTDGTSFFA